jgi:hypothetical protein
MKERDSHQDTPAWVIEERGFISGPLSWRGGSQPLSLGAWLLLFIQGAVLFCLAFLLYPKLASQLVGRPLEPGELLELLVMRWGMAWFGLALLGWSLHELLSRRPGPRVLFTMIAVFPVLIPFWMLGYGWDPNAWEGAFSGEWIHRTGQYWMSRPPGYPLFEGLAALVVPHGGWTALLAVNTLAGFLGCLVWCQLPEEISMDKQRLIAFCLLLQPLFLLACGTGLEPVWQATLVGASAVVLLKTLSDDVSSSAKGWMGSGALLGFASGFAMTSLVVLPVWVILILCYEPSLTKKAQGAFLLCLCAVGVFLLCELPVLLHHGISVFRFAASQPEGAVVLYRLLRFVLPPPALVLTLISLALAWRRWESLERAERMLVIMAVGVMVVQGLLLMAFPSAVNGLAVVLPFLAVLWALLAPRGALAFLLPAVALWGLVSAPLVSTHPAQAFHFDFHPIPGPLVEEAGQRLEMMRRGQQLLMASPSKKTAIIVGRDWPMIATLRPDWVVEKGILRNPAAPVEFHAWIDHDTFGKMKTEGTKLFITGESERTIWIEQGYDPVKEGAIPWKPNAVK